MRALDLAGTTGGPSWNSPPSCVGKRRWAFAQGPTPGTHRPPVSARDGGHSPRVPRLELTALLCRQETVGIRPGSHAWERRVAFQFGTGTSPLECQVALTAKMQALVSRFLLSSVDSPGHRAHFAHRSRSPGGLPPPYLPSPRCAENRGWMGRGTSGAPAHTPPALRSSAGDPRGISAHIMEPSSSLLGNHQPIFLNDHKRSEM